MIGEEVLHNLVDEYGMVILASEHSGDSLIVDYVRACQTECETQNLVKEMRQFPTHNNFKSAEMDIVQKSSRKYFICY